MSKSENKNLIVVEDLDQMTKLLEDTKDKILIVDFWASWCGPCVAIAPWFKEMSEKYINTAVFAKVDVDENSETSEKYEISCMPTFKAFYNGELFETVEGADKNSLEKLFGLDKDGIDKMIKEKAEAKAKKEALEKIFPLINDSDKLEEVKNEKCLTAITFVYEGYKEEADQFNKEIDNWVEETNKPDDLSLKIYKVNLDGPGGQLGNTCNVRALPYVLFHSADGEMVQALQKEDATLEKVKNAFNMTSEEIQTTIKTRKEKEAAAEKACPQLDDQESYDKLLAEEDTLIVVDYYATWCGPCIGFAPTYKELALEYSSKNSEDKKVKFCKIDCDKNSHAKKHAEVKCYPTFKLWKNKKEVGKLEGASKDKLVELIEKNLA